MLLVVIHTILMLELKPKYIKIGKIIFHSGTYIYIITIILNFSFLFRVYMNIKFNNTPQLMDNIWAKSLLSFHCNDFGI